uniref:Uncharacterized protein n=1 Tax=Arion vulgaris TaxID=1028688 RepID=A0A0B6XZT9_9EUPU
MNNMICYVKISFSQNVNTGQNISFNNKKNSAESAEEIRVYRARNYGFFLRLLESQSRPS